jgi:hypothetical protein
VGSPDRLRVYRLYCAATCEERLLQLSDRLRSLHALCQQSHGRSYSAGARLLEGVLLHGAQQVLRQAKDAAAAAAPSGDFAMADAQGGGDSAAAATPPEAEEAVAAVSGYSEEAVARLLAADPAEVLGAAAGNGSADAGALPPPTARPMGPPGSGLEGVSVADLSAVRSELEEGGEEAEVEGEEGEGELSAGGAGADAEASRAEAAAAAARQWASLLGEAWGELQREEEAALRAAGHEGEAGDEATNDEDGDDVRRWLPRPLRALRPLRPLAACPAPAGRAAGRHGPCATECAPPPTTTTTPSPCPFPRLLPPCRPCRKTLAGAAHPPSLPAPLETLRRSCGAGGGGAPAGGGAGGAGARSAPSAAAPRRLRTRRRRWRRRGCASGGARVSVAGREAGCAAPRRVFTALPALGALGKPVAQPPCLVPPPTVQASCRASCLLRWRR